MKRLSDSKGMTLTELMVTVAVCGIMVGLGTVGFNYIQGQRAGTASRDLMSDLQRVRQKAITHSAPLAVNGPVQLNRGYGVRFTANNTYVIFEYIDTGVVNFQYEGAAEEYGESGAFDGGGNRVAPSPKTLAGDVRVTLGDAGDPVGDVLIYDKKGIPRTAAWAVPGTKIYVVRSATANTAPRCVLVNQVRIREGRWDGANCLVS